jgi:hypothetical protein
VMQHIPYSFQMKKENHLFVGMWEKLHNPASCIFSPCRVQAPDPKGRARVGNTAKVPCPGGGR